MMLFNTLGLAWLRNLGLICCFPLKCPCSEESHGGENLNPKKIHWWIRFLLNEIIAVVML